MAGGATSTAIRHFHRQLLWRAAEQLDEVPAKERFIQTSVVAIPSEAVAEMQAALEEAARVFVKRFEDRARSDQIYQLSFVLMPLLSKALEAQETSTHH